MLNEKIRVLIYYVMIRNIIFIIYFENTKINQYLKYLSILMSYDHAEL